MELHIVLSKEEKERQKVKGGSFKYTWQPPGLEVEKVTHKPCTSIQFFTPLIIETGPLLKEADLLVHFSFLLTPAGEVHGQSSQ